MDDSPFGRLPGEIRNQIWRLALVQSDPINITHINFSKSIFGKAEKGASALPGILSTCREIRKEASDICYGENTFTLSTTPSGTTGRGLAAAISRLARKCGRYSVNQISTLKVQPQISEVSKVMDATCGPLDFDSRMAQVLRTQGTVCRMKEAVDVFLSALLEVGLRPEAVEVVLTSGIWHWGEAEWVLFSEMFGTARADRQAPSA